MKRHGFAVFLALVVIPATTHALVGPPYVQITEAVIQRPSDSQVFNLTLTLITGKPMVIPLDESTSIEVAVVEDAEGTFVWRRASGGEKRHYTIYVVNEIAAAEWRTRITDHRTPKVDIRPRVIAKPAARLPAEAP